MIRLDPVAMLGGFPLFAGLSSATLEAIAGLCRATSLRDGATLFLKGDVGDSLYGIRRGQIAIELSTTTGASTTLAFLGPGDIFGEIALLDGGRRTADAVATASTELFALRRVDVLNLIGREPAIGIKMIEVLCQRLRVMTSQVEQGFMQSLDARIATRILQLADRCGTTIVITQDQLARSVGVTRETVNRQLRSWAALGIIELRRGRIVLSNAQALRVL